MSGEAWATLVLYLAIAGLFALLCRGMMKNSGYSGTMGWWLGFLFGPLGIILVGGYMAKYHPDGTQKVRLG